MSNKCNYGYCSEDCIPYCNYGQGYCTSPYKTCPHWHWAPLLSDEDKVKRNCHKCVYEVGCHGNPVGCKSYKRDAPDGGYYG